MASSEDTPECVLPDALCLALRISRWFGLAPLRLRGRHAAPAPLFSPITVYSHALLLLTYLNIISLNYDKNNVRITLEAKDIATVLIGFIITVAIYTQGVVSGTARMKCIVDTLLKVDRVILDTQERFGAEQGQVKLRIFTIFIFMFPTVVILLIYYQHEIDMLSVKYTIYQIVTVVGMTFLNLQFVLVVTSLSLALRTVTDRISTVFANIDLYSLEATDIEIAEAALRDATRRYCQLNAAARRLCRCFSYHLTMSMTYIVLTISCLSYLIIKMLMVVPYESWPLVYTIGWLINTTINLIMINESSHTLHVEGCRLSSVVNAVIIVRGPLRSEAMRARRNMALLGAALKPARLFTLGRPLTAAVGGIVFSHLLSIYYLGNVMEVYFEKNQENATISY